LKAENKLGLIDGTRNKPEIKEDNFTEYHARDMVHSMVCPWLLNMIDRKLRPSVANAGAAKVIWEDLQKKYGVASAPKIYQLKARTAECRQGGMTIVELSSKLRGLWSELDNHVKIPTCMCSRYTCKGCECNVKSRIGQMFEAEKSYQFLLGLNDDFYSQIQGQILATKSLASLEKVFNIITQEKQHKRLMVGRDDRSETAAAYVVNHTSKPQG